MRRLRVIFERNGSAFRRTIAVNGKVHSRDLVGFDDEPLARIESRWSWIRRENVFRTRGMSDAMTEVGAWLFSKCFMEGRRRHEVLADRPGVIEIEVADERIGALPWEMLCAGDGTLSRYLALQGYSVLRVRGDRAGEDAQRPSPIVRAPVVRILAVMPSPVWRPTADGRLAIGSLDRLPTVRKLVQLRRHAGREAFDFHLLRTPTLSSLQAALQRGRENVLYFFGHGTHDELLMEDGTSTRRAVPLGAKLLFDMLAGSSIRLVILSACDSARVERTATFAEMARALVAGNALHATVGFQLEMPVFSGEAFDAGLLEALATLEPFDRLVAVGRSRIIAVRAEIGEQPDGIADWAAPVLLSGGAGALVSRHVRIPGGEYSLGLGDDHLSTINRWRVLAAADVARLRALCGSRTVVADGFEVGAWPVTNHEYGEFVRRTGHRPPAYWRRASTPANETAWHPVVGVSANDARAYCRWSNARLPTADEWEIASRGKGNSLFPWGDERDRGRVNIGRQRKGTVSVFAHLDGRGPFGVLDTVGNVYEWTSSRRRGRHVIMGGAWDSDWIQALSALRPVADSTGTYPNVGFRIARD